MKVQKFGGTSVGTAQRMKEVVKLVTANECSLVVLSAMSGTTNALLEISDYFAKGNKESAAALIGKLHLRYKAQVDMLYSTPQMKEQTLQFLQDHIFAKLLEYTKGDFTPQMEKDIVCMGEIMSTNMVANYCKEQGIKAKLLNALDFMRISEDKEPDLNHLRTNLMPILEANADTRYFITQGFICLNHEGNVDNLQRGGSDYTASLIGAAIKADVIEIWTDIDGMHNNDPRYVEGTKPVRHLHFEEAAELAYFGAKILHPTCVLPAKAAGIPVRLLNTMEPEAEGTLIDNHFDPGQIKAVAAKDDITAVKIVSTRMLAQTGFLRRVFEIFESYNTPIDMVTTSEVGISMTIDNTDYLANIVDDLKQYGTVVVDRDMCIICVVGDLRSKNIGFESTITNAMRNIPIRMISFGGSEHNISFLINQEDKQTALKELSKNLFQ